MKRKLSLEVPPPKKMSEAEYDRRLKVIQRRLSLIQQSYFTQKLKAVIVFEGLDAAGKGGLIRRLAWAFDPRGFRVFATSAPTDEEKREHYLQRFWRHLPPTGAMTAFDRSWYGRVLVERVEGFASTKEWTRAYGEINQFEKTLTNNNCRVIKVFLNISAAEQARRFRERLENQEKRWKLTFEDFRNRGRGAEYYKAFLDMFKHTSTASAPWRVIAGDNKHVARIEALEYLVQELSRGVKVAPPPINSKLKRLIKELT